MADYYEEFVTGRPGVVLARDRDGNPTAVGVAAESAPECEKCGGTGIIPDPDRGSGWGPYWDDPCDCQQRRENAT